MAEEGAVWKFGYGSNMSQAFLREKKLLNPLDFDGPFFAASLSFKDGEWT